MLLVFFFFPFSFLSNSYFVCPLPTTLTILFDLAWWELGATPPPRCYDGTPTTHPPRTRPFSSFSNPSVASCIGWGFLFMYGIFGIGLFNYSERTLEARTV
ncbi:hypothetical protein BO71DRAFT_239449 [Aspergillus ellipticus CBS 707.79]|uniref:Uncharacterized protein n=1 Tax=Aspergillus ellipticus CBS 707.79 TaxID=1448320 RepID=A0A319ESZ6_9EURO|nr:hypothetical protein BO71DRAFT_239449 [Aspergillus ellipticus CBS 707.79]